ncbi:hypothetical protein [Pseudaestuariivita rosea]|uniref:hypothetical protein n=1 Tax=Pseudaestuariivita rosea TaxID=2763263 RepID=UPI001ABB286A|nr:hypothetical protein [Pseudaestuariivita rosea]
MSLPFPPPQVAPRHVTALKSSRETPAKARPDEITDDGLGIIRHSRSTGLRTFFMTGGAQARGYYARADLPSRIWTGPHPTRRAALLAVKAQRLVIK